MKRNNIDPNMQSVLADYATKKYVEERFGREIKKIDERFVSFDDDMYKKIDQYRSEFKDNMALLYEGFDSRLRENTEDFKRYLAALSEEYQHRVSAVAEVVQGNSKDIRTIKNYLALE